jgi:serine/threonine protein kinase
MSSLIGQSLGRYKILEQLGEGGMATVYKAHDSRLDRFVAIKVIRTDQFAPNILNEMMNRFEREAKALAKLSHPNIVHVHDYGEYEGAPYLVMEYLPCGALKQVPGTPMAWQQVSQILLPIAHALAYAHEHNIIHRDIKPGNILLTEKGLPMLSDFGIAKILESDEAAALTGTGVGIGTPEYMAPEQWTGQSGPKSDIYSLGVVLYELVTGRKPYKADTPIGVMLKQVKDPLPRPSEFVPDLPEGLENVILKALEKQPEDRYQNMSEFAAALEALAGGGNPPTGPTLVNPIPPERHRKTSIKWGLWIPITGLVVLLCIGLIMGRGLVTRGLKGLVPSVEPALLTATSPLISPSVNVKVLWDISHGPRKTQDGSVYTPDGMYKSLVQVLSNEKYAITSGDLTDLNSYEILVLSELSGATPYTKNEVDKIEQFVRVSGHGLLILSDTPGFENLADIVGRRFSVGLGELTSNGPVSHSNEAFFSGVTLLQFFSGGGILQVSPPSQTAASDQDGNSVIAFCECDAGRVMVISDSNLWDNQGLNLADNQRFAINVFQWLAKLSP